MKHQTGTNDERHRLQAREKREPPAVKVRNTDCSWEGDYLKEKQDQTAEHDKTPLDLEHRLRGFHRVNVN